MIPWYASVFTGLFRQFSMVPTRAHDPALHFASGVVAAPADHGRELIGSGAGWDAAAAEAACVGEAVERWQAYPLPDDQRIEASFDRWPLDEPAAAPERWVLFHPEQYARARFPFEPWTRATVCRWVCCRRADDGAPCWVPDELVYLALRPGEHNHLCPGYSTGLACGRAGQPVLLRALQEVIERDAVVGAWWGSYLVEEWPLEEVLDTLPRGLPARLRRPNLRYRCYRVGSPFSAHVTVATAAGEDREGYCIGAGAACRETRAASWEKSLLEAVHSRQYARYLKAEQGERRGPRVPCTFADHAVYYSLYPEELRRTVVHAPPCRPEGAEVAGREDFAALAARLGSERPVLFRNMTPPALAQEGLDWRVLRVVVPGLQPLHGAHHLPHLGGPLWGRRTLAEWAAVPPHPFP